MTFAVTAFPGWNGPNGQHCTELVFSWTGPKGAVVWRMTTGISPAGQWGTADILTGTNLREPSGMGFSFHEELTQENASAENYELNDKCEFLDGRACVCRYSTGMLDKQFFTAFACDGFDGVEQILSTKYHEYSA